MGRSAVDLRDKNLMTTRALFVCLPLVQVALTCVTRAAIGPHFLGSTPHIAGQGAAGIAVQGNFAYVASGTNGLVILDISNPTRPTLVGSLRGGGSAVDVFVRQTFAFVAYVASGRDAGSVQVIDVQDPANPKLVGSRRSGAQGVAATDTHLYFAAGIGGMVILDYSNPANPVLVGGYDTPRNATSVRVFDDKLFVTDSFAGLYIFDLTNPGKPARLGNYDSPGYLGDVWVQGNLAFLADGASGLSIVDFSDPSSPVLVGRNVSIKFANRVLVSGNLAYVATTIGWQMVDVSNPAEPVPSALYQLHDGVTGAAAAGDRFLVCDVNGGLSVFADNPGQTLQELALFSPKWDRYIGFSVLVPVNGGAYALEVRPDVHSPWITRTTFGAPTPGVRRVIDFDSANRPGGFYRVTKQP